MLNENADEIAKRAYFRVRVPKKMGRCSVKWLVDFYTDMNNYRHGFRVEVTPGHKFCIEDDGHVFYSLTHEQEYVIILTNDGPTRCDCRVEVDGTFVGKFRVNSEEAVRIERPSDSARNFVFLKARSSEGRAAGIDGTRSVTGVIRAHFAPECPVIITPRKNEEGLKYEETEEGSSEDECFCFDDMFGGEMRCSYGVGGTGLGNASHQKFSDTSAITNIDKTRECELSIRLVLHQDAPYVALTHKDMPFRAPTPPRAPFLEKFYGEETVNKTNALCLAALRGNIREVILCLQSSVTQKNFNDAMVCAVAGRHIYVVEFLAAKGVVDDWNRPLRYAAFEGDLDMVKRMIKFGADQVMTAACIARDQGYPKIVDLLLQKNECNIPPNDPTTTLKCVEQLHHDQCP